MVKSYGKKKNVTSRCGMCSLRSNEHSPESHFTWRDKWRIFSETVPLSFWSGCLRDLTFDMYLKWNSSLSHPCCQVLLYLSISVALRGGILTCSEVCSGSTDIHETVEQQKSWLLRKLKSCCLARTGMIYVSSWFMSKQLQIEGTLTFLAYTGYQLSLNTSKSIEIAHPADMELFWILSNVVVSIGQMHTGYLLFCRNLYPTS